MIDLKIKRIKTKALVSAGTMNVLPSNPIRPEVELTDDARGVMVYFPRTEEYVLVPWNNIVEIIYEEAPKEPEPEVKPARRRGRPKKDAE